MSKAISMLQAVSFPDFFFHNFSKGVLSLKWTQHRTTKTTDDGYVMAFSQILYGQYRTWDICVLGLKTKMFYKKNKQIHFPMDKRLTIPK